MLSLVSSKTTRYHSLSTGLKFAALFVFSICFVMSSSLTIQSIGLLVVIVAYAVEGTAFLWDGVKRLRPLLIFIALICVWHTITLDIEQGLILCLRITSAVAFANLVTMTTPLQEMKDAFLWLLQPLKWVGINTASIALALAIMIRFVPVFLEQTNNLRTAHGARSTKKASWRIVFPVAIAVLDNAEHVTDAIRARRGY